MSWNIRLLQHMMSDPVPIRRRIAKHGPLESGDPWQTTENQQETADNQKKRKYNLNNPQLKTHAKGKDEHKSKIKWTSLFVFKWKEFNLLPSS